jgi:hypothetical protein
LLAAVFLAACFFVVFLTGAEACAVLFFGAMAAVEKQYRGGERGEVFGRLLTR